MKTKNSTKAKRRSGLRRNLLMYLLSLCCSLGCLCRNLHALRASVVAAYDCGACSSACLECFGLLVPLRFFVLARFLGLFSGLVVKQPCSAFVLALRVLILSIGHKFAVGFDVLKREARVEPFFSSIVSSGAHSISVLSFAKACPVATCWDQLGPLKAVFFH